MLCLVFCASCVSGERTCQKASPNFVVVLVDDQAWNGTSVEMVPGMPESASDFTTRGRFVGPKDEVLQREGVGTRVRPVALQHSIREIQLESSDSGGDEHRSHSSRGLGEFAQGPSDHRLNVPDRTFWKMGMGGNSEEVGTTSATDRRKCGWRVRQRQSQWETEVVSDPKRVFELTIVQ